MNVILLQKIKNLGSLGAVVKVKPGYARNFLIPFKHAVFASKANLAKFEAERATFEAKEADKLAKAQAIAEKIQNQSITITCKASEEGKLFGSLGTRDIAKAISEQCQVELGKSQVRIPGGTLRTTGSHEVGVHLHSDLDLTLNIEVVAQ